MADEQFKIFVEQLRDGRTEEIEEVFPSDLLDVREKELSFSGPIKVKGQAYLAEDMLVMHLDIEARCRIPCSICNDPVEVEIVIRGLYHTVPLNEVKGAVYNFRHELREAILLETPYLAECNEGKCPQRDSIKKYLKNDAGPPKNDGYDEGYKPFAGLNLDK